MENIQTEVTKRLLEINTIKIQPDNPFTWASGWKSPIYCDNRKTLSYPETRSFIRDAFVQLIQEKYPEAEVIAGVATGAIAIGALVADKLGLPFIYVRSKPKGHGLENLIEGDLKPFKKVVVVEDLVSTGISSLKAAEAVNNFGGDVVGMVSIFTYNFPLAKENFQKAGIELTSLSRYQILIDFSLERGDITKDQVESLMEWREDPANWGK
ncbi:orotate phosphoribosyltransferase [Draconibacterium orientale]|uniref:Orotate phosphoribosyltransferase n=1 Tax=Draconibacterium orientale TaxID=1168034 RepID=X5DZS4_9BACT|nr:orotate phosphoribosyltransferase [Draconibacterium orientale]AHW59781.1 orotate phosphoribosyltransferase [Draconibacterium orientale]SET16509.1 orotate phosphoribosyltransferase [Draconibacterium orientale]